MREEIARYLVIWNDPVEFIEPFKLWRSAMLWHKTIVEECDPLAKLLYWHAGEEEYREASLPAPEHAVTRLALFVPRVGC